MQIAKFYLFYEEIISMTTEIYKIKLNKNVN